MSAYANKQSYLTYRYELVHGIFYDFPKYVVIASSCVQDTWLHENNWRHEARRQLVAMATYLGKFQELLGITVLDVCLVCVATGSFTSSAGLLLPSVRGPGRQSKREARPAPTWSVSLQRSDYGGWNCQSDHVGGWCQFAFKTK